MSKIESVFEEDKVKLTYTGYEVGFKEALYVSLKRNYYG